MNTSLTSMKNLIVTFLLALSASGLFAQNFWYDNPYINFQKKDGSVANNFIITDAGFAYGCDGMNNEFVNKFYKGGYLDSAFIEKSTNALLPVNRIGAHTNLGIIYSQKTKDTSGERWSLGFRRRMNISGRFSDDAFRLAFQGNTRFKGEEADFSRTRFNSMSWTQIQFGYVTPQPQGMISFSFSLLAGHRYNQADIEYGTLYTDSQGLNITSSVSGDYWASDTSNTTAFALNGMGTSVDITYLWYEELPRGNFHSVRFDLIDFGFINWNNKTIHQTVDTSFEWSGIDVTPFFIDPNYVAQLPSESDFIKSDTGEFHRSIFLPAVARGMYTRWLYVSRVMMKVQFAVPLWSEAIPYGAVTTGWRNDDFMVSTGIAYGGYARVQVPIKAEIFALPQSCLEIGTTNALSLFSPDALAAGGAYLKLSYSF